MTIGPRGIPEVPILHEDWKVGRQQIRRFLQDLRQNLTTQQKTQVPLIPPTNLTVTAEDRGNLIQFTRSPNADYFEILWSNSSNIQTAQILNVTTSNGYFDYLGSTSTPRFYWVRARRNASNLRSLEAGPVKGTTAAVGTTVTFPNPPPIGQAIVRNTQTGRNEYL